MNNGDHRDEIVRLEAQIDDSVVGVWRRAAVSLDLKLGRCDAKGERRQ
jgi:hypothetical protein